MGYDVPDVVLGSVRGIFLVEDVLARGRKGGANATCTPHKAFEVEDTLASCGTQATGRFVFA